MSHDREVLFMNVREHVTYYEAHITMMGERDQVQLLVEGLGWKFSCIDGDPVLGAGVKCYATHFMNPRRFTRSEAINDLNIVADKLESMGAIVTRRKIEEVIYDDRSDKVNCNGMCPECV
jgi:hypothetical protein